MENISELRSFIGFVNYYGRFIKNLNSIISIISIIYPLNKLLHKNTRFCWTKEYSISKALQKAKVFPSKEVLAHFDPKVPLVLTTDTNPWNRSSPLSHLSR